MPIWKTGSSTDHTFVQQPVKVFAVASFKFGRQVVPGEAGLSGSWDEQRGSVGVWKVLNCPIATCLKLYALVSPTCIDPP